MQSARLVNSGVHVQGRGLLARGRSPREFFVKTGPQKASESIRNANRSQKRTIKIWLWNLSLWCLVSCWTGWCYKIKGTSCLPQAKILKNCGFLILWPPHSEKWGPCLYWLLFAIAGNRSFLRYLTTPWNHPTHYCATTILWLSCHKKYIVS